VNLDFIRAIKGNRMYLQALLAILFILGLILVLYALTSRESPDTLEAQRNANSTRTAVALTSQALLAPFPTSTAPTSTPSETPSQTLTPTRTPTNTRTPTQTPIPFITLTARTGAPGATLTSTPRPTRTQTQRPRPTATRTRRVPPTTYP
jgi:hypothetical protein